MDYEKKRADMNLLAPLIIDGLKNNSEVKIIVTGNSMFPMLRHRQDTVTLIKPVCLKKYDIPFYKRDDGGYILHRIVKVEGDSFYIAGDNQTVIEYPVRKEQVIGVVSGFTRKGKFYTVNHFLYQVYVRIWCVLLPHRHKILTLLLKIRKKFIKRDTC